MTTNGNKKQFHPKSLETELLEKRLLELEPGQAVSYEDLTKIIGMDVRPGKGRGYQRLHSARQSIRTHVFFAGDGGVRRLTDSEILELQATRTKHIHKTANKSQKEILAVDVSKLTPETKVLFNLRLSHALLLAQATTAASVKRISAAVAASQDKLPANKCGLALFTE